MSCKLQGSFTIICCFIMFNITGQGYGVVTYDTGVYDGYTLFSQLGDTSTFLIDNCGNVVHNWEVKNRPGNMEYLLEDGSLLRCAKDLSNSNFTKGGYGGWIEKLDWDGNYLWEYLYSDGTLRQHHDIEPLPNGNVLILSWELKDYTNAVDNGRDPSILVNNELWPEHIVEVEPVYPDGGNIVWEWHIWDHLVQDYDNTKSNYGVVADHPELMDINAHAGNGGKDWLHANSIDYNANLDQIMLSLKALNEIIIIDHSTTTVEAASHAGGNSNMGGDLLYRWGNPVNYDRGTSTDKMLFGQHNAYWIEPGLNNENKIQIYNNQNPGDFSSIVILDPPVNGSAYDITAGNAFLPVDYFWEYQSTPNTDFYSGRISGSQTLPNNNVLICEGNTGRFFEINENKEIVWEYITPIDAGNPVDQSTATSINNSVFRSMKYSIDYSAFLGRDLSPKDPIELNPDNAWCNDQISGLADSETSTFKMYPNPSVSVLHYKSSKPIKEVTILSIEGKIVKEIQNLNVKNYTMDVTGLTPGSYMSLVTFRNGEKKASPLFKTK